ncbi:MAG: helix-turn-helix domain-containing protein [Gammaproteobacteria bacterium]|nr:helix-turn-helix domain-containing protein [Gammaproteobacteria bacterium]
MSIPADIDLGEVRAAIRRELVRTGESRYHRRLHGVLLVANGLSATTVAAALGDNPRTVQRWLKRYQTMGLDGLRDRIRPGRPTTLNARQRASLARDLDRRPAEFGLPDITWSGPTLATHLRERYASTLGIRQCQRLLKELRDHATSGDKY